MKSISYKKICIYTVIAAAVIIPALISCTKDKTPRPAEPCDPDKVYFQRDIMPLLNANCAKSGCHDAITKMDGVNLSNYDGVMKVVRAGRPGDSEIVEVINEEDHDDRMPPPPNTPLNQQQKDLISRWISEGALNLVCEEDSSSCETGNVSYSNDISTIVNNNCIGCHNNTTSNAGINLSTHGGVQAAAGTGKLYHAVAHTGQATPMPPNMKLPACEIQKIKVWIDGGSLNN